jgi:hypothetical protein
MTKAYNIHLKITGVSNYMTWFKNKMDFDWKDESPKRVLDSISIRNDQEN